MKYGRMHERKGSKITFKFLPLATGCIGWPVLKQWILEEIKV